MRSSARRFLLILMGSVWLIGCQRDQRSVTVFAAASLTDVVEVLADSFRIETGRSVRLNLAASSVLARQIESGALANVYLPADPEWGEYLVATGLAQPGILLNVKTHLVLVWRPGDGASLDENRSRRIEDTTERIRSVRRLALGDPAHVPAGRYARTSLECLGVWDDVESRVVPTIDVRAALAAVYTGGADAAVVYASDAHQLADRQGLGIAPLRALCQPEIRYSVFLIRPLDRTGPAVRFSEYIAAAARRSTWERFGFEWL